MSPNARQRFQQWYRLFDIASIGRWRTTLILTLAAYGLFVMLSPPVFYRLGAAVETNGHVMRDNHTVRYEDLFGQRHIGVLWVGDGPQAIWGMPVRVRYLSYAPAVSWLVDEKWDERATFLFVPFLFFVALPLSWLWSTTILRPAREAWRAVRNDSGELGDKKLKS